MRRRILQLAVAGGQLQGGDESDQVVNDNTSSTLFYSYSPFRTGSSSTIVSFFLLGEKLNLEQIYIFSVLGGGVVVEALAHFVSGTKSRLR